MLLFKKTFTVITGLLFCCLCYSQKRNIQQIIAEEDNFNLSHPREKIFIHTDKPYYFVNDTIWLKGYMVFASDHSPADSSNIIYIEIINNAGAVAKRISTYAAYSEFFTSITLDKSLVPGNYLLRAYTNYLRNFGDSVFFTKPFSIYNYYTSTTNADSKINATNKQRNIREKPIADPVSTAAQIDLQFFAEGGSFITGKYQQLGFKAINKNGYAVNISGTITTENGEAITEFKTIHNGMGTVWLTPKAGEKYKAVLKDGTSFNLPQVQASGLLLQVSENKSSDSIRILISGTEDFYGQKFFLRTSCKGLSYAKGSFLIGTNDNIITLSKNIFPSGVCHATLYNTDGNAVNERAFWIWHNDAMKFSSSLNKNSFSPRDSVHVVLNAFDANNNSVRGSFSVAVIDTSRIYYNTAADNILSYFLLTSEMKGHVEDPYYYFSDSSAKAANALMLTQGWVQYNIVLRSFSFAAEKNFSVNGKVTNLVNKPVSNSHLNVFGKDGRRPFFLSTQTDENGHFHITDMPVFYSDSVSLFLSARNKRNKTFGIGITMDDPPFDVYRKKSIPEYNEMMDAVTIHLNNNDSVLNLYKNEKGVLKEVVVNSRIKIRGSKNLNEDGGADEVISSQKLMEQYKSTLLDVLYKEIKGFNLGTASKDPLLRYKINGDIAVFIIDGYNISQYFEPVTELNNEYIDYLNTYLKYLTAADVAGVEIMQTLKNKNAYELYYNQHSDGIVNYTYIEITTYSGNGAFQKNVPGTSYFRPLVPVVTQSFYTPKYATEESKTNGLPDLRTTIHWEPNIVTNEKGQASFSFYTADNAGGYLIIVMGSDMMGNFGFATFPITVQKK